MTREILATSELRPVEPGDVEPAGGRRWPTPGYWARSTIAVLSVVVGMLALYRARSLLLLILISLVLAIGLQRPIEFLERRGLRRAVAIAVLVVGSVVFVAVFLALVLPPVVRQGLDLSERAPKYLHHLEGQPWMRRLNRSFKVSEKINALGSSLPSQALTIGSSLVSAFVTAITVMVLTVLFANDLPRFRRAIGRLLPPARRERFEDVTEKVVDRVGGYVNGNLVISVIAGTTSFVAMLLMGVPYAAALAFWVAVTDLIPTIGAILGAAAAVALAATVGVGVVIGTIAFFVVYQSVENYVIGPRVMKGAIDMSMGAVLVAVLAGGEIMGLSGIFVALPVAAAGKTVLDELYLDERKETVKRIGRRQPWPRGRRRSRGPNEPETVGASAS